MPDNLNTADLHREMIRRHLQDRGIKFFTDEDGDALFIVTRSNGDINFSLAATPDGEVVWMESVATDTFATEHIPLILLATNTWMGQHRWPRLTIQPKADSRFRIIADGHLAIGDSLDQVELDRFIESTVMSTMVFWDEFSVPNIDSLETEITGFLTSTQRGKD